MDALRRIKNESLQAALLCLNIPHVSVLGLCRQAKPKTGFCDERSAHTSYAVIVSPKLYTSRALRKCWGKTCTLIDIHHARLGMKICNLATSKCKTHWLIGPQRGARLPRLNTQLESRRRRTKGSVVGVEWCQNAAPPKMIHQKRFCAV